MTPATTTTIRFGTDGWRARIADEFTFDNVRACAKGLADHVVEMGLSAKGVVVGYDTRFLSDQFAAEAAGVIAKSGIPVWLANRAAPTPATSFAVTHFGAAAGVMITASHNPAQDNGFKVKSALGGSAPPEMVALIEARVKDVLSGRSITRKARRQKVARFDPMSLFRGQLKRVIDIDRLRGSALKVVVDPMYGSGSGILPKLLRGGNLELTEIRSERNPAFPGMQQPEPVAANLRDLMDAVTSLGADVGIALDGDSDRVGIVSEGGVYFTTLEVFSLLAHHLWERRHAAGGVACTITQSAMLDSLARHYKREVFRTAVGFKFVGPAMLKNKCALGGEESGGYAFDGHIPERDGALSGLLFLEAMVMSGKKPSELLADLHRIAGPHTFRRIDLKFANAKRTLVAGKLGQVSPARIGGLAVKSVSRSDGVRIDLKGGAWAVARLSGTEPLVRLYAEATDERTRDLILAGLRTELGV